MSKPALFFLALLLLAGGSTALLMAYRMANTPPAVNVGSESVREIPAEPLEKFELTAQTGLPFHSQSLDGQVWIASFFFATCPASCRQQNEAIAALQRKYGEQGVKFVAISVDPATDDPASLSNYAQRFGADPQKWYFLTDRSKRIDYIQRVGTDIFKVPVTTQGHLDALILVDRDGKIHDYYNWKKSDEIVELHNAIETLLARDPSPAADLEANHAADDSPPSGTPGEESGSSAEAHEATAPDVGGTPE